MAGKSVSWPGSGDRKAAIASGDERAFAGLAWATAERWRPFALLAALCLVLFVPGFFQVPVVDRDEARFVQTSRQMLESGNFVDLRFHDQTRYKKPIGIYWLHSAAATVTGYGDNAPVWVYRLVSLLGATLAVLLTYRVGTGLVGREAAFVAAALLAACVVMNVEARLAKTDAALLATVVAAQLALSRIYMKALREPGAGKESFAGWPLLFWAALGVGVLIKGPIAPMISGLTIATLVIVDRARWVARLRPVPGLLVLAAIVLPWLIAIGIVSEGRFFQEAVGRDMLGKVAEGQESHGAPPGYHFLLFWVVFWPGAALVAASVPKIWRSRRGPATRFLLAWIIPNFVVFEIVATKLPHYPLPTYPAIALLAATALMAGAASADRSWGRLFMMAAGLGGILVAFGAVCALVYLEGIWSPAAIVLALAVACVGALAMRAAARGTFLTETGLLLVQAALVYWTVFGAVAPRLDSVWVAPRLAAAVEAAAHCENPEVMSAGYTEASLIFAIGTDIRFGDGTAAGDFLRGPGCRVAIVTEGEFDRFVARAKSRSYNVLIARTLSGINIGNSRWLTFQIATRAR